MPKAGSDGDRRGAGLAEVVGQKRLTGQRQGQSGARRGCLRHDKGKRGRHDEGKLMFGDTGGRAVERSRFVRFTMLVLRQGLTDGPRVERGKADGIEVALQAGRLMQGQQQRQHIESQHREGHAHFADQGTSSSVRLGVHGVLDSPGSAVAQDQ